jgi:hypothetical protein
MNISMKLFHSSIVALILLPAFLRGQQANVNLDYNPQKDTEGI